MEVEGGGDGAMPVKDKGRRMNNLQHALLLAAVFMPTVLLCFAFSVMGQGDETYLWLDQQKYSASSCFTVVILVAVLLHVLDSASWELRALVCLRYAAFLVMVLGTGAGCCILVKTYSYATLQFAMLLIPASVFCTRRLLMPSPMSWRFFVSLAWSLSAVACISREIEPRSFCA